MECTLKGLAYLTAKPGEIIRCPACGCRLVAQKGRKAGTVFIAKHKRPIPDQANIETRITADTD